MGPRRITAADAIAGLAGFDAVIDARSESEFAEDRLPGAVNWPVLNDDERRLVGIEYKQVSPFDARKRGAALVARNIARHIETQLMQRPRGWRPLVYCWRGGQRSEALAIVLDRIGFTVHLLEGGYRAFRRAVIADLATRPASLRWRVLCGSTGSAKSRLLQALADGGGQVLDLEALACHRGSVLGPLPGREQPSQKAFETWLWQALRRFDPARTTYVESESRTIGRLRLPEPLLEALRAAPCLRLRLPMPARARLLLDDYAHFVADTEAFCTCLAALREFRGAAAVERWQAEARAGRLAGVVEALLTLHYDPVYERSMRFHFAGLATAPLLELPDAGPATLARAAAGLLAADDAAALRPA